MYQNSILPELDSILSDLVGVSTDDTTSYHEDDDEDDDDDSSSSSNAAAMLGRKLINNIYSKEFNSMKEVEVRPISSNRLRPVIPLLRLNSRQSSSSNSNSNNDASMLLLRGDTPYYDDSDQEIINSSRVLTSRSNTSTIETDTSLIHLTNELGLGAKELRQAASNALLHTTAEAAVHSVVTSAMASTHSVLTNSNLSEPVIIISQPNDTLLTTTTSNTIMNYTAASLFRMSLQSKRKISSSISTDSTTTTAVQIEEASSKVSRMLIEEEDHSRIIDVIDKRQTTELSMNSGSTEFSSTLTERSDYHHHLHHQHSNNINHDCRNNNNNHNSIHATTHLNALTLNELLIASQPIINPTNNNTLLQIVTTDLQSTDPQLSNETAATIASPISMYASTMSSPNSSIYSSSAPPTMTSQSSIRQQQQHSLLDCIVEDILISSAQKKKSLADKKAANASLFNPHHHHHHHPTTTATTTTPTTSTTTTTPLTMSSTEDLDICTVTFLGTGSATPSKYRNSSCIMLNLLSRKGQQQQQTQKDNGFTGRRVERKKKFRNPFADDDDDAFNDGDLGLSSSSSSSSSSSYINNQSTLNYNIIMLDVGESTASQLFRSVDGDIDRYDAILLGIKVVWISHHHADHITGLPMLLEEIQRARMRAEAKSNNNSSDSSDDIRDHITTTTTANGINYNAISRCSSIIPSTMSKYEMKSMYMRASYESNKILVIASEVVMKYFEFSSSIAGLDDMITLYPILSTLYAGITKDICLATSGVITRLRSIPVQHCHNSYGLVLDFESSHKIVYSGDCRPSQSLVNAGKDCDLLIHEATFEDSKQNDAIKKRHSTTSEARSIASRMKAKHTILTHFSQRYPIHIKTSSEAFTSINGPLTYDRIDPNNNTTSISTSMSPSYQHNTMINGNKQRLYNDNKSNTWSQPQLNRSDRNPIHNVVDTTNPNSSSSSSNSSAVSFDFLHFSFPSQADTLPMITSSIGKIMTIIDVESKVSSSSSSSSSQFK